MNVQEAAGAEEVALRSEGDLLIARQKVKQLCARLGFSSAEATAVSTAVSELARNVLVFAGSGTVRLAVVADGGRRGLMVEADDHGPGIADVEAALQDGYSTSGSLGIGLPGARRLMDDFEIRTAPGTGTLVRITKWA